MTIRLSTGLRNMLCQGFGLAGAFNKGSIAIYSGSQPATADSAVTGTLLGTVTVGSGALTQETAATGTVTVTGGSGTINTLTVGGLNIIPGETVPFNTSTDMTAADLAAAVNRCGMYTASSSAGVVTLSPRPGAGAAHNAAAVTASTTLACSYSNMAGGVAAVNGLVFSPPSAGAISKNGATWSFNGIAGGTAGWFHFVGAAVDAGGASTTLPRLDGTIAVSGGDMALSNITIAIGAPTTIDTFSWTQPAQ